MKSLKEFVHLSWHLNPLYAIYYIFYKINLKFTTSGYNQRWLSRVYSSLLETEYQQVKLNGIYLYKRFIPNNKNRFILLRKNSSDNAVFNQVLILQDYKSVIKIYDQLFDSPPQRILDCGANIGLTSLFFADHYPAAQIWAIEPSIDNFQLATENLLVNKVSTCKLIRGAVWDKNTILKIAANRKEGNEWGIQVTEDKIGLEEMQAFSLNDLIQQFGGTIDILKIDIEGAEKKLFGDEQYAAQFLGKTKCLAMEIHDEFTCREGIYELLSRNNFFYYDVKDMTIAINKNYL